MDRVLHSKYLEWSLLSIMVIFTFFSSYKDYNVKEHWKNGVRITKVNNYYIFIDANSKLMNQTALYAKNRSVHYDLYKYSPTFALLMGPIAALPDFTGLLAWNYLNLFAFILAIKLLPFIDRKSFLIIVLLCVLELLGSIQNEQSNGLMTGLILLFLALMERKQSFWAIAFLALSVYIKLFSLVFFVLLLFYPGFIKNSLYAFFWMLFLFVLPAFFTSVEYLIQSYEHWYATLSSDHGRSIGYSVMGILNSWFNLEVNKIFLVGASFVVGCLPLFNFKIFKEQEARMQYASLLLIWVVIFNHKAESPLFVIAMTGIGLWYVVSEKNKVNNLLIACSLLFVSIAFSELVPMYLKDEFFYKFNVKALLPLLIWGKIIFDLTKPKLKYDSQ